MKQTLTSEAEHFWYFNNGITIVCNGARKTAEKGQAFLRVSNPQIINGQQTTRTLEANPEAKSSVLVRVISIPRDKNHNEVNFERLVSKIVGATNWQNAILKSDLRSNDKRQVALERDLAKVQYRYIRKRQTKGEARRVLGSQHCFWIKKEELAQFVGGCELDPQVVRSGKEGLFEEPFYDEIFDGRPSHKYLSCYWLARGVKRLAAGYPDRAYAKWVVLNALWSRIGSELEKKNEATAFRLDCERNQWNHHLDKAVELLYLSALTFYRTKKGVGAKAVDISNFFYRANLMAGFESFWRSSANKRRKTVAEALRKFIEDLSRTD